MFVTLKFITNHPLTQKQKIKAIFRFIKWQISIRLNPSPIIHPFTDKSSLIVKRGMAGATGNLYCGLHEYHDMLFLLHLLRESDCFGDIGANIGSYTVLASGHVGVNSISVEPVPSTYSWLKKNILINDMEDKVFALNIAIGDEKGVVNFTKQYDAMNHVACENDKDVIKVPIETLDDILVDKQMPILLKVDVEGFETDVIRGAKNTLNNQDLKAIIIELNGSGKRYGYDERKIHYTLIDAGFKSYTYNPLKRSLNLIEGFGTHNTIYVRDIDFVQDRLEASQPVNILNQSI